MPTVSHRALSRTLGTPGETGGWSGSRVRHRSEALAMIYDGDTIVPRFDYRIHRARILANGMLSAGGRTLHAPGFLGEPGELTAVAAAACTLGTPLQDRISELFATRRRSLALALDAVANELLFRLADRAAAAIRREARRVNLEVGLELNPGDAGLALEQQAAVLALTGSEARSISISDAGMLVPARSLSMLVALGHHLHRRSAATRCEACPSKVRCAMN